MAYQVYYNGLYLDEHRALIPAADRAFLVGEGLFETLRAYERHVVFLDDHLKRMSEAASVLGLDFPVSMARLKFLIYETLHVNRLSNAVIRVFITPEGSGIGDLDSPPQKINLLISCRDFTPFPESYYREGVSCVIAKGIYAEMGLIAQMKSTSYLTRVLTRRQAKSQGAFEGILLNAEGEVTEGSGSNLFVVQRGKIYTPPLSSGLLAGVTRAQVFGRAEREGIALEEKKLLPGDLWEADELFLTSTLKEVMPVSSVDGKKVRSQGMGPVTERLRTSYREWVQWQVEQYLSDAAGMPELV
ncbi:MAG: aminotransferase class IV [bacterium]